MHTKISTCKRCGKYIELDVDATGETVAWNRDGSHHFCGKFRRRQARRTREIKMAYGPAPIPAEDPNQMRFDF